MRLTPKQCAARAGCSPSLIYSLLRQGRLAPAVRLGCRGRGRWLVEEAVFEAYVRSCQVEAGPALPALRHIR